MEHHLASLRQLKLKATPKRLAILGILAEEETYSSPEAVWQRLKAAFGTIGLPTVYRNLEELAAGGVISQVLHPNRQLYYYYCGNREHHHHFICLNCRRVEDVASCSLDAIEREIDEAGGRVVSHIVQINGLCGRCAGGKEKGQDQ